MSVRAVSAKQPFGPTPTKQQDRKQKIVVATLGTILVFQFYSIWLVIFSGSSLPGSKFQFGLIFGLAQSVAALSCGYICKYMSDKSAYVSMAAIALICYLAYYLLGEGTGGLMAQISLFFSVFGLGAMVSLCYLLIELRVPPSSYGSTMVFLLTCAIFCTISSPIVAHMKSPTPQMVIMTLLSSIVILALRLPEAGEFLQA